MPSQLKLLLIFPFLISTAYAQITEAQIDSILSMAKPDEYCQKLKIELKVCKVIYQSGVKKIIGDGSNEEIQVQLEESLKTVILQPDYLNKNLLESAFVASKIEGSPLTLEFAQLDRKDADNVLGLKYSLDYSIKKGYIDSSGNWDKRWGFKLLSSGTITQNAEENPRNFIDLKVSIFGSLSTEIPTQDKEFIALANKLIDPDNIDDLESEDKLTAMFENALSPLAGYQWYTFGVDLGLEADQEFKAKQNKISGFVYGQYESWTKSSFIGTMGIVPSIRIGVDSIDPNKETPRALAGDDSSYYRISGEASLWVPLGKVSNQPLALTFNYRTYDELSPSDITKSAKFDKYRLRTYALSGPYGLYVSYSSGQLPMSFQSEQLIELGLKLHL
jgi:hypothetical protein